MTDIRLTIFIISYIVSFLGFLPLRMFLNRVPEANTYKDFPEPEQNIWSNKFKDFPEPEQNIWSIYKALFFAIVPIFNVIVFGFHLLMLLLICSDGKIETTTGVIKLPRINWLSKLNQRFKGI